MTKQTEALKLALEAFDDLMKWQMARDAVREALAQPEQEPKCGAIIEVFGKDWRLDYMSLPVGKHKLYTQQYTYTTPPQRKCENCGEFGTCCLKTESQEQNRRAWVGLTDEEVEQTVGFKKDSTASLVYFSIARAIEDKLKEKNT